MNTATYTGSWLLRFDPVQRAVHWVNAVGFGVLIFTGIPLYFGTFFGVIFPRHEIQEIHLWVGIFLPVPILLSLVGPWGRRMRRDFRRFNYWSRAESRWLLTLGRNASRLDKFNPGQKFNALFVGAGIVIMWASGYVLQWFHFFPVSWRVGATATHDFFAFALFVMIVGHVVMALTHRDELVSMLKGSVKSEWAHLHAREWSDEETSASEG